MPAKKTTAPSRLHVAECSHLEIPNWKTQYYSETPLEATIRHWNKLMQILPELIQYEKNRNHGYDEGALDDIEYLVGQIDYILGGE